MPHAKRPFNRPVVILGFGPAAMSAVDALRGVGYAGDIVVVTDGGSLPASRAHLLLRRGRRRESASSGAHATSKSAGSQWCRTSSNT